MADPAFLFYAGDYLRDTQCLSESTQVAYDRIMCEHMRNICEDMNKICITKDKLNFFTKRLTDDQKSELLSVLHKVEGGYQIDWVAQSISKRKKFSISRSENRLGSKKDMKTYVPHMENENENTIEYWERLILNNTDNVFEQLLMSEGRKKKIEARDDWVKQHTVKAVREKWKFSTQQEYRVSLMGYLRSCNNGINEKRQATHETFAPPPKQ